MNSNHAHVFKECHQGSWVAATWRTAFKRHDDLEKYLTLLKYLTPKLRFELCLILSRNWVQETCEHADVFSIPRAALVSMWSNTTIM